MIFLSLLINVPRASHSRETLSAGGEACLQEEGHICRRRGMSVGGRGILQEEGHVCRRRGILQEGGAYCRRRSMSGGGRGMSGGGGACLAQEIGGF